MSGSYHGQYTNEAGLVVIMCAETPGGKRISVDAPPEVMEKLEMKQIPLDKKAKQIFKDLESFIASIEKRYSENLLPSSEYVYGSILENFDEKQVQDAQKDQHESGTRVVLDLEECGQLGLTFKKLPDYKKLVELQNEALEACKKIKS